MHDIANALRARPELALFLTLAAGYAVGSVLLALAGTIIVVAMAG